MRIGLKVTIQPDNHDVALIRGVVSIGGAVVFGLAIALLVAGAVVGRRKANPANDEGPRASSSDRPFTARRLRVSRLWRYFDL